MEHLTLIVQISLVLIIILTVHLFDSGFTAVSSAVSVDKLDQQDIEHFFNRMKRGSSVRSLTLKVSKDTGHLFCWYAFHEGFKTLELAASMVASWCW